MADPPVLREQPIRARKRQHLRRLTGAAALCIVGGLLVVWRVVGVGGVTFIDCGVLQLHYDMSTWYSADPQTFGLESVPAGWRGEGIVLGVDEDRLTFRDWSGRTMTFSRTLPDQCD